MRKTKKNTVIEELKHGICAPHVIQKNTTSGMKNNRISRKIVKPVAEHSCLTLSALKSIASAWNKKHPGKRVKYTNNGKELWNRINKAMSGICNNEYCWLEKLSGPSNRELEKAKENFRPDMPDEWKSDHDMWLSTLDIKAALEQYEKKYDNFEFIGPVPIDFDATIGPGQCVVNELCKINIKRMINHGKDKIGIVFNLDKHTEDGSHWVALFVSLPDKIIGYWDSFAVKPASEIETLITKLTKQARKAGYDLNVRHNNVRHQYKSSECGVYCIHFIISMLEGIGYDDIVNNVITDDQMNSYRKILFIP